MELIIGGAYQNKTEYVQQKFNAPKSSFSDGELVPNMVIDNLQKIIYNMLKDNKDPVKEIDIFLQDNPEVIFICDEIGCGIVPLDAFERSYRDVTGKICCYLAQKATKVHRVICGIGTVIKDG